MNRRLQILLVFAVLLLAAVGGYFAWMGRGSSGPLPKGTHQLLGRIDEIRRSEHAADSPVLVPLTEHQDPAVARAAMDALAEIDPDTARNVLERQLRESQSTQRRAAAAAALGRVKAGNPATLVATLASERDGEVRAAAARGLARYSGPERRDALPALVAALRDPDPKVRRWAIRGIHRVSVQRFFFEPNKPPGEQEARIAFIERRLRVLGLL
jgi:HEAT repeat protein